MLKYNSATENIHHAWQQGTANNKREVQKCILPSWANSSDFEEETVIEEITNIGRKLKFDGLENDVCELFNWKNQLTMIFYF
jgi:hypothetical protein